MQMFESSDKPTSKKSISSPTNTSGPTIKFPLKENQRLKPVFHPGAGQPSRQHNSLLDDESSNDGEIKENDTNVEGFRVLRNDSEVRMNEELANFIRRSLDGGSSIETLNVKSSENGEISQPLTSQQTV